MINSIIFIISSKWIKRYQYNLIDYYKKNPNYSIAIMLYENKNSERMNKFSNITWKFINYLEKHRFKNNKLYEYDKEVYIEPNISIEEYLNDIEFRYDIIINLSDLDLPKKYIESTNYGLIQARTVDVMKIDNLNKIFSKYNKDGQLIIIEYCFGDKVYYNNHFISNLKYYYLNKVNSKIRSLKFLTNYLDHLELFDCEKINKENISDSISFIRLIKYIVSQIAILINGKILQFMYKYKKWSVCICNFNIDNNAIKFDKLFEISDKKRGYADPFLIKFNNRKLCFLEDYLVATGKGDISLYEISDKGPIFLGRIIEESFHLSYPYVFEDDGALYLVPESSKNNDIRLYKCVDFPLKWKLHKVLINDISAVDTIIFKDNELWWLLTNINSYNNDESSSELHIYYANDLINSNWTEHIQNPVSVSINNGRNGGSFLLNLNRIRVGQAQKSYMYGHSFTLNKITKLDRNVYEEFPICTFTPPDGYDGTHHLSICGKLAAYDQYK
jgi:hypothetical protein